MRRHLWVVMTAGALVSEALGLFVWRWSWGASFGPERVLPEAYDLLAPSLAIGLGGGLGLALSLAALHEVLARGTRLQVALATPLLLPLVFLGALLVYALLIVWGLL